MFLRKNLLNGVAIEINWIVMITVISNFDIEGFSRNT